MKKSLLAMAVALATVNVAHAETSGFYLGGQLGSGFIEMDLKKETIRDIEQHFTAKQSKLVGAINVGYNFKSQFDLPIRTELSYTARDKAAFKGIDNNEEFTVKHRLNSLMFNTYYDIYTGSNFTPYISLGLGTAFLKTTLAEGVYDSSTIKKRNFAYSTALGVNYKIADNWSADIMARGTYNGKFTNTDDDAESSKSQTYDVMVGLLYNF